MPDHTDLNPTTPAAIPPAGPAPAPRAFRKYLIVAADMATYDGDQIEGYRFVKISAESEEHALRYATSVLEEGILPLTAFTADDLRQLADELTAHPLAPGQAFNDDFEPPDGEAAEPEEV